MMVVGWLVRARIVSSCRVCGRGLRACRWRTGCGERRRWLVSLAPEHGDVYNLQIRVYLGQFQSDLDVLIDVPPA